MDGSTVPPLDSFNSMTPCAIVCTTSECRSRILIKSAQNLQIDRLISIIANILWHSMGTRPVLSYLSMRCVMPVAQQISHFINKNKSLTCRLCPLSALIFHTATPPQNCGHTKRSPDAPTVFPIDLPVTAQFLS